MRRNTKPNFAPNYPSSMYPCAYCHKNTMVTTINIEIKGQTISVGNNKIQFESTLKALDYISDPNFTNRYHFPVDLRYKSICSSCHTEDPLYKNTIRRIKTPSTYSPLNVHS